MDATGAGMGGEGEALGAAGHDECVYSSLAADDDASYLSAVPGSTTAAPDFARTRSAGCSHHCKQEHSRPRAPSLLPLSSHVPPIWARIVPCFNKHLHSSAAPALGSSQHLDLFKTGASIELSGR